MVSLVGTTDPLTGETISEDIDLNQGGSGACAPTIATVDLGSWPSLTYQPGAVHWDGRGAYLHIGGPSSAPNSHLGTLSMWMRFDSQLTFQVLTGDNNGYNLWFGPISGTGKSSTGLDSIYLEYCQTYNHIAVGSGNAAPLLDIFDNNSGSPSLNALNKWFHILASWNTDIGTGQLAVNGASITTNYVGNGTPDSFPGEGDSSDDGPFDVPWNSDPGFPISQDVLFLNNGSSNYFQDFIFSVADLWLLTGTSLDLTQPANIAKFVSLDGYPVDLGSDGSNPTGTQPTFFFHLDKTDSNPLTFCTNRGTGGTFTLSGNSPAIQTTLPKVGA